MEGASPIFTRHTGWQIMSQLYLTQVFLCSHPHSIRYLLVTGQIEWNNNCHSKLNLDSALTSAFYFKSESLLILAIKKLLMIFLNIRFQISFVTLLSLEIRLPVDHVAKSQINGGIFNGNMPPYRTAALENQFTPSHSKNEKTDIDSTSMDKVE